MTTDKLNITIASHQRSNVLEYRQFKGLRDKAGTVRFVCPMDCEAPEHVHRNWASDHYVKCSCGWEARVPEFQGMPEMHELYARVLHIEHVMQRLGGRE